LDAQVCTFYRKSISGGWITAKTQLVLVCFLVLLSGCKEDRQNKLLSTTREYDTTSEASDLWSKAGGIPDSTASDGIKPMSYADNGDGTITDHVTKLIWQKIAPSGTYIWNEAINYCKSLELAGFSDWQLPDIQSLLTIVDFSRSNPAINKSFFLANTSLNYWSSTDDKGSASALTVFFNFGDVVGDAKASLNNIRCVRSAW
jgi:hypothetical protein